MIGGLLVDVLVIAAVLAFAWGAAQLGGLASIGRLCEAAAAVGLAALLRDPAGHLIEGLLGTSVDFSRLLGMLLVGLGTWIAANRVYRWWRARRAATRLGLTEEEESELLDGPEFRMDDDDPLDRPGVARAAGALMGLGWVLLFLALLVLQPANTPISRAAVASRTGGLLIHRQHFLEWLREGFPHYTQTLPKGKLGAVVGEQDDLPMRDPVESRPAPRDVDAVLRSINKLRRNSRVRVLAFNPDIAGVARRHAASLAQAQQLSYASPGGGPLDQRVITALGESSGSFSSDVGEEIAWAHDPATVMRGLLATSRARELLADPQWSEIGIGVVDTGWFNGRIYVLLLVGEERPAADAAEVAGAVDAADAADAAGSIESTDPSAPDSSADTATEPDGSTTDSTACTQTDLDGDGVPDPESVDPSCDTSAPVDDTATGF